MVCELSYSSHEMCWVLKLENPLRIDVDVNLAKGFLKNLGLLTLTLKLKVHEQRDCGYS